MNDDFSCYDCLNVQIMVRTRDLSWALGRVIGRILGREVNCDSHEGSQRQRLTTFARTQQEAAPVVEDVQHVDHAANEVHEQPEEATVDDVVPDAEGFQGDRLE